MPGKVNPVIPEAVSQVVAQVYGNDAAVAFAGSQGNFELNVYLPVIARNLLESIRLLASVTRLFADRCVAGIEADVERCRTYAEATPQAATALNPLLGYERVAELVKESATTGKSIRTLAVEHGLVPEVGDRRRPRPAEAHQGRRPGARAAERLEALGDGQQVVPAVNGDGSPSGSDEPMLDVIATPSSSQTEDERVAVCPTLRRPSPVTPRTSIGPVWARSRSWLRPRS